MDTIQEHASRNHQRHQTSPSSEDAIQTSIGCRNKEDPGRRALESGRQLCCNRGQTEKGHENSSHPEEGLGGRVRLGKPGHRHARFSLGSPLPVGSDLYITTGLQTLAITKKRSRSSAEEESSSDCQDEDGGASKKTASTHFNVTSSEPLPLPRSGPVPVVTMIVHLGEREEVFRILRDTGSTVPLLSRTCTQTKQIPVAERPTIRLIQNYAGQEVEGAVQFYSAPLILQHRHHFSRVSFEVTPLASDYNTILPCWWLAKHKCDLQASNGCIKFTSADCQQRCTADNQNSSP